MSVTVDEAASTNDLPQGDASSSRDRFWNKFRSDLTKLMIQMDRLQEMPNVGAEKIDGIDHCLAGIIQLQRETELASHTTTAHNKKIYADSIDALKERLSSLRSKKPRFAFKQKKNSSAIDLTDLEFMDGQQPRSMSKLAQGSGTSTPGLSDTPPTTEGTPEPTDYAPGTLGNLLQKAGVQDAGRRRSSVTSKPITEDTSIRRYSFDSSSTISIKSHNSVHIVLPSSAVNATKAASIHKIRRSIIDMGSPTTDARPFASLTLRDVKSSLLNCGSVAGPTHITNVHKSVIVLMTRQFRMHDCSDCIVYLFVSSQPIIEDCSGIEFAEVPKPYEQPTGLFASVNQYDQVQDFKWHRTEQNPHWSLLDPAKRVPDEVWTDVVPGGPGWSIDAILKATGVEALNPKGVDGATSPTKE